jgi:hypothetical protein
MNVGTSGVHIEARKLQVGLLLAAMLAAALLMPSGLRALAGVSPPAEPTFVDVGVNHPFYEDIEWMAAEGISEGYLPGPEYRPSIAVSRAAMSAFMYRLAGSPPFAAPGTPSFSDVGINHPFYTEIEWMAFEDITTGFPDNTYRPGTAVSRQSMSAFMYRLAGEPLFIDPLIPSFTDVSLTHPFYSEIEWMAAEDISEGYQPGPEYRPSIAVSRQAMSAFMHRLADGPGVDI